MLNSTTVIEFSSTTVHKSAVVVVYLFKIFNERLFSEMESKPNSIIFIVFTIIFVSGLTILAGLRSYEVENQNLTPPETESDNPFEEIDTSNLNTTSRAPS